FAVEPDPGQHDESARSRKSPVVLDPLQLAPVSVEDGPQVGVSNEIAFDRQLERSFAQHGLSAVLGLIILDGGLIDDQSLWFVSPRLIVAGGKVIPEGPILDHQ